MWVLVAAIFVGMLVALYLLSAFQAGRQAAGIQSGSDEARVTASQAVHLMPLCMQQAVGTYTQAQLGGSGFPSMGPAGNAWVCQVTAGGSLPTGNAAVLYLDGPPKVWALAGIHGQSGTASGAIQMNFATQVTGDMAQPLAGQSDVSAGVVQAGDAMPLLHVTQPSTQDVSLSGDMPGSLTYTAPALAAGVSKSSF